MLLIYGYGDISTSKPSYGKRMLECLHKNFSLAKIEQGYGDTIGHVILFKRPGIEDMIKESKVDFDINFITTAFKLPIDEANNRMKSIESALLNEAAKEKLFQQYGLLLSKKPIRIYANNPSMAIQLVDKALPLIRERVFGLVN